MPKPNALPSGIKKLIRTIVKREFQDNILSFKFIACVLVAIVLVIISTIVQTDDYLVRLDDYHKGLALAQDKLTKVPAYSFLRVSIYKKPSALSIFIPGMESRTGSFATVSHREIPTSLKGGRVNNEFAWVFSFFDLSSVVVGIFTILAVLLAYSGMSGEKESGTLSLVLSNAVPRARFLIGKYLGGLITLAIATVLCFLSGSIILLFFKGLDLGKGFFLSVLLIFLFSLLYLSSVLLFGILMSSLTKASFMSLVVVLAFYLVAVFLMPLAVNSATERSSARIVRDAERNVRALEEKRSAAISKIDSEISPRRSWTFMKATEEMTDALLGRLNPPDTIAYFASYIPQEERLREDYALKIYELRQQDNGVRARIDRVRNWVLAISPASCFSRAAELEADTGRLALDSFFSQLTLYWHLYVRYLDEKDALSLKYAYPYSRDLAPTDKSLVDELNRVVVEKKGPWYSSKAFREVGKHNAQYEKEIKPLDLSDMPIFHFQKKGFVQRFLTWLPCVLVLFVDNLLFFLLAYFAFVRYDPRPET